MHWIGPHGRYSVTASEEDKERTRALKIYADPGS